MNNKRINKKFNKKFIFSSILLIFVSFFVNYFVASRGVFPVDTFIHFDPGYRILNGELPIKDYWIVHGLLVDYLQAIFFFIFGANWIAYLIHSSFFNSVISLFLFYFFFRYLKINLGESLFFSFLVGFLAYPVSGTPFLDLHSSYFSLFAIILIMISMIENKKDHYWFYSGILFVAAFLCKQVPASYVILVTSIFCLFYSLSKKNYKIILYYSVGGLSAVFFTIIFLLAQNVNLYDLVLQLFLFPTSIGESRYLGYELNFSSIFLNYKFIYLLLASIFFIIFYKKKINKKIFIEKKFGVFFIFFLYVLASIFHQIYTKNQIYIFFLIPTLGAFSIYFLNDSKIRKKKYLKFFIILFCLVVSLKYIKRFDLDRKFHELKGVNIGNSYNFEKFDKKFKGLYWISPYFLNPEDEISKIKKLREVITKNNQNIMLLTEYKFFSLLMNQRLNSPSRTFDDISYPKKNSKYFLKYKIFLKKLIINNEINSVLIFESKKIDNTRLEHLVFDYISSDCFKRVKISEYILKLDITNCEDLSINEKKI